MEELAREEGAYRKYLETNQKRKHRILKGRN